MPPIDPMQLLNCLKVLLNEETGGIKGPAEAIQISRLMGKFSKKIVSKSLYVFILKETKSTPNLLNIFMDAGGWGLIYLWLKDAVETDNIVLIRDLLSIFHIVPVTMERLKANGGPKLVKKLSKSCADTEVKSLAQELVDKWLTVVKTEHWHSMMNDKDGQTKSENSLGSLPKSESVQNEMSSTKTDSVIPPENQIEDSLLKTRKMKKNDIIIRKEKLINNKNKEEKKEKWKKDGEEKKIKTKEKNSNPFLRIINEMKVEKSDDDKVSESDSSNSSKHSNSRRKQNLKTFSSEDKLMKDKLSEDKASDNDTKTTNEIKKEPRPLPPPAPKPKLPESKTLLEKKNYSIHVEKKEYIGEKKPTVKTFKSKFRSTGLEEQAPPPPLKSKKTSKCLTPLSLSKAEKRSLSPPSDSPNEKKPKNSPTDIKKLPPKIKESGLFMDAMLNVLNSAPKNCKKRKTKPEALKKPEKQVEIPTSPTLKSDNFPSSPSQSPLRSPSTLDLDSLVQSSETLSSSDEPQPPLESPLPSAYIPPSSTETTNMTSVNEQPNPIEVVDTEKAVEKPPQLKFYRDTLLDTETSTSENKTDEIQSANMIDDEICEPEDKSGLKSVLVYVRSKSSKKSVSWKQENDLVQVSYFEHDENERVNVTRNFKDMEMHERDVERQNFLAVRKLNAADIMEPKTAWQYLDDTLLVDVIEEPGKEKIEPGYGSQEKKKQTLREQSVLPAIYNNRLMIPDSPSEPDHMEITPYSEPLNIPLEDITGDGTAPTYNYVSTPWPESKGEQPPVVDFQIDINNMMPMAPNVMMQPPQFPVFNNPMNWNMPPVNIGMPMRPPVNNMFMPNPMMMNNQTMYNMGDQMPQQPIPQQPPSQQHPQNHPSQIQEEQWMGPEPTGPMQHDQHWGQQQPPNNNNGPAHFERGGGRGHSRWDNPRGGNNYNDSYRGKHNMNRNMQRGNRGGPYNRRGHMGNGRPGGRLCKYYAKQGFCKTSNCAFLHSKN
ncbi:serine/threonine-protein phosphatase 1 regulatory subunit 10-like [Adelges cooleyi]|uniref:serine/threonine-protein phosphatase 1 regulatory subunit 10-like n=1 Tax=Adelges cooleyi TaxID=133065 RepID=UPI00218050D3|nr:serine/threonine-protein phosphatase 1 regulatory subunit 10-like [Adelges cooleyi]